MPDGGTDGVDALIARFDPRALDAGVGRARIRLVVGREGWRDVLVGADGARPAADTRATPDTILTADRETWERIAADVRGGLAAHRAGRLTIRKNVHVGVAFLAATSGATDPERLRFRRIAIRAGELALAVAGDGEPVVLLHGLGATKGSFLPTIAALAERYRVIAPDLPGFGDSCKPLGAAYDPKFFAAAVVELLDALGARRAHVIGNSMGGRIALELGLRHPERVQRLVLLAPSLAWRRARPFAPLVRALRPELGLLQVTPRWVMEAIVSRTIPGADTTWVRAGLDEFLRAYQTPRGRVAFYAAARHIYLEEPHGADGFWTRLAGLHAPSLFVWGTHDTLVPIGFARHVRRTLPWARHVELDCGHVPQIERAAETHAAIIDFLRGAPLVHQPVRASQEGRRV